MGVQRGPVGLDEGGEGGPIPGGMSYENFELEAPFVQGQEFWFGVTPETVEKVLRE